MTNRAMTTTKPPEPISKVPEMALLGSLIWLEVEKNSRLQEVANLIDESDFAIPSHRTLYKTLRTMKSVRREIDLVLLRDRLAEEGTLYSVGGPDYLTLMMEGVPHPEHVLEYAIQVRKYASQRRALEIVNRIGTAIKSNKSPNGDLGRLQEEIDALAAPDKKRVAAESNGGAPVLVKLSDVTPSVVRWLWPGRIPLGKLTILDGDPGLGKTLMALDVAARVSTGREMPDGIRSDVTGATGVVVLSAEDDPSDTLRPRLDAAGGDPKRVVLLSEVTRRTQKGMESKEKTEPVPGRTPTLSDIQAIKQAIEQVDARLVIIDPVMAYLGDTDSHVDSDIRSILTPLSRLAAETGTAILLIRHLNKATGGNPIYRGGGSIGIIAAARAGLVVGADPDDESGSRRVLAVTKSNLSEKAPSMAYSVVPTGSTARIEWCGTSDHTAATILKTQDDGDERSTIDEAIMFLRETLTCGPKPATEIQKEARGAGVNWRSVERAKAKIGVQSKRVGFGGPWSWALPVDGDVAIGRQHPPTPTGEFGGLRQNGPQNHLKGPFPIDRQPDPLAAYGEVPLNASKPQFGPKAAKTANGKGEGGDGGGDADYERREREAIEGEQ